MKHADTRPNNEKRKYKSKRAKIDNSQNSAFDTQNLKLINISSESNNSGVPNEANESSGNSNSGLQTIYDLLEWQWDQGKSLILQQCEGTDVADLLDTLHLVKTENDALEAKLLKLQMKKNHLKAINARLKSSLASMNSSSNQSNLDQKNSPIHNKIPISPCVSNNTSNNTQHQTQRKKSSSKKETEMSHSNHYVPITPNPNVNINQAISNNHKAPIVTSSIITDIKQLPACISNVIAKSNQPGQTQIQLPLNQLQSFLSQANLGINQNNFIIQKPIEIEKSKINNNNNFIQALVNNSNFSNNNNQQSSVMMMVNNNSNTSSTSSAPFGIENKHIEDANRLLQVTQQNFNAENHKNNLSKSKPTDNSSLEQMNLSKNMLNCLPELSKACQKTYNHDQNFVNYAKSFMTNSNSQQPVNISDQSRIVSDGISSQMSVQKDKNYHRNEECLPLIECVSPHE